MGLSGEIAMQMVETLQHLKLFLFAFLVQYLKDEIDSKIQNMKISNMTETRSDTRY